MDFDLLPKWLQDLKIPFGGEDGDSDPNSGTPPQQQNPPTPQSDQNQSDSSNDDDDDDDDDDFTGYSVKELRRIAVDLVTGKKAVEAERDSLKGTLTKKEREKLDKEQRLEVELSEEKKVSATLRATNAKLAIVNAIICETKHEWHNPQIVAQQLNPDIVKVDDNGNVEGLRKELDRVAKDHAYLLKTKEGQQHKPTGFQPGQGGAISGGSPGQDAKELAKTYPALANRL